MHEHSRPVQMGKSSANKCSQGSRGGGISQCCLCATCKATAKKKGGSRQIAEGEEMIASCWLSWLSLSRAIWLRTALQVASTGLRWKRRVWVAAQASSSSSVRCVELKGGEQGKSRPCRQASAHLPLQGH